MHVSVDDLHTLTGAIWAAMLGLDFEPAAGGPGGPHAAGGDERTLTGCVHVSGGWDASVTVELPESLAVRAAAAMFGCAPDDITGAEVEDALGELTNMTGGGVKALVPQHCELSLPTVVLGDESLLRQPRTELRTLAAFHSAGGTGVVRVYEGLAHNHCGRG